MTAVIYPLQVDGATIGLGDLFGLADNVLYDSEGDALPVGWLVRRRGPDPPFVDPPK